MLKFIGKRLLMMLPVLLGVMFVIFTLTYLSPGDPAVLILGEGAAPETVQALRDELGLNDPFVIQFARYVAGVVQLDFGTTFQTQRPVFVELAARFPTTFQLAVMGSTFAIILGVPLGILSATRQYSLWDTGATFFGLLGVSIPNFWLGMMLIMFFTVTLNWLPPSGFNTPLHWIMPTITIGASSSAIIMRMTRSSMLEVIRQDYIRTAKAKGQTGRRIITKHALRNAMIPVVTVVGLQLGGLMGGAVLTETIFSIPGIGSFMVQAISQRDLPIIQGGVLLIAIMFSFVNLLVDVLYAFIDPRIKSQYT